MKDLINNFKIFEYIKKMNEDEISHFINYSKIYSSVIELELDTKKGGDNKPLKSDNVYDRVANIMEQSTFIITQDLEDLKYRDKEKNEDEDEDPKKRAEKDLKNLIDIKNQIHIKKQKEDIEDEDDIIKYKCKILNKYKNTISNLEEIIGYMKILRTKGSSLPIKITVNISLKEKKKRATKSRILVR
jgi:hypothetical protein